MTTANVIPPQLKASGRTSTCPGFGERARSMGLSWLLAGAVSGTINALHLGVGFRGFIAYVLAGIIVFVPVGILLAVFVSRAKESLLGAAIGLVVGILLIPYRPAIPANETVNVCLLMGVLFGATCWPIVRLMAFVVRRLLMPFSLLADGATNSEAS